MILGILKELETENRVAMLPGEVAILRKLGVEVIIEKMPESGHSLPIIHMFHPEQ